MGEELASSLENKISEEGAESDVRKGDRQRWWAAGRGWAGPHLFSVSCFPCFHSWLPGEIPGMCMGRLELSREYGLLDLRDEYLPVLEDEEFNPPWRL